MKQVTKDFWDVSFRCLVFILFVYCFCKIFSREQLVVILMACAVLIFMVMAWGSIFPR